MTIRLVPTSDATTWDALVADASGGTSFHRWSWLQLHSRLSGWRFIPLIVEERGTAVGVVPVLVHTGVPRSGVRPAFPYVGPLVPPSLLAEVLIALRRWQLPHLLPILRLEFGPDTGSGTDALSAAGYVSEVDSTFVVQLAGRTDADLEKALASRRRRAIRQADRNGVSVRPSAPGEIAALLPRLLGEAFGARELDSPYPRTIGSDIEEWARGRDDVYSTTVLIDGVPVGAQVALTDQDTVYGWAGGTLRDNRATDPFTVLAFDLFRWSRARGHRDIDLVGKVDEGVSAFKRSLGGVERPYVVASSVRVPSKVIGAFREVRRFSGRGWRVGTETSD